MINGLKDMSKINKTVGVVMAGGEGTRLFPSTKVVNKHLLPIYDKPMIYYPISVLMLAEIKEILIICSPNYIDQFKKLLGNGKNLGLTIKYKTQKKYNGIVEGIKIARNFIADNNVCLILGDNLFYGQGVSKILINAKKNNKKATIFGYNINDPENYGVAEIKNKKIIRIVEKPKKISNALAIPGIYFYSNTVIDDYKKIKKSNRNEFEISDLNNHYLSLNKLKLIKLNRGVTWIDCGSFDNLIEASKFVQIIEKRQGLKIGCLEEISFRSKWITAAQLIKIGKNYKNIEYKRYIDEIVKNY